MILYILIILFCALLAAIAQLVYKRTLSNYHIKPNLNSIITLFKIKGIDIGIALYATSLLLYLYALSKIPLVFAYTTFSSVFIFVLLISKYVFHENVGKRRVIGTLLIVLGIAIYNL